AAANGVSFQRSGDAETQAPSGKLLAHRVRAGDRYTLQSGGGGGFGSPLERMIESVEEGVPPGDGSGAHARGPYGVITDPKTGLADQAATTKLRHEMRAKGLPVDAGPHEQPHVHVEASQAPNLETMSERDRELVAAVQGPKCCG